MRVSFVSGSYPPIKCGIGDYTARLARTLSGLGVPTAVLTSTGAGPAEEGHGPRVVPVVETWRWRDRGRVIETLARQSPDIVNVQYPTQRYGRRVMINLLPYYVSKSLKVPAVYTVHEFSSFTWVGRMRIALSAALSAAVIVPDRENLSLMGKSFPFLRARLHHVPIGPNIVPASDPVYRREVWRQRYGATNSTVVISCFGFLSPSKGLETLLEALEKASAASPDLNWQLLLIADREPSDDRYADYHHRVERLLEASPISKRVYWTGYCTEEEVSQYLSSSDICCLPFTDGATLRRTTLLSAFCHGLPVISTRPRGNLDPELLDGQNVLLLPPGDSTALAGSIVKLAKVPEKRFGLAEGALGLAQGLSWESLARRTLEVYRGTLDRPQESARRK